MMYHMLDHGAGIRRLGSLQLGRYIVTVHPCYATQVRVLAVLWSLSLRPIGPHDIFVT